MALFLCIRLWSTNIVCMLLIIGVILTAQIGRLLINIIILCFCDSLDLRVDDVIVKSSSVGYSLYYDLFFFSVQCSGTNQQILEKKSVFSVT